MEAGVLRQLRKEHKTGSRGKKQQKSNFVRFFESLQNRGPISMHETLYIRYTKAVRTEMEAAGTWVTGKQDWSLVFIAEYISRLQRQFWKTYPTLKWYIIWRKNRNYWDYRERLKDGFAAFSLIYMKMRRKGMADRTFRLSNRGLWTSTMWAYVQPWVPSHDSIDIRPYTEFNDHGVGI